MPIDRKYQIIQDFEKKLNRTFWFAAVAGLLHTVAKWLGGGAVTWATVVLMGGFASQLPISDFLTITLLVLLIIFVLTLALFSSKLVTKKSLSTGSIYPLRLCYRDSWLPIINVIKLISCILQCVMLIHAFKISTSKIHRPDWRSLYGYALSKPQSTVDATALRPLRACLQSCATNLRLTAASDVEACSQFCFPAQNSTCSVTANLQVCFSIFYTLVIATCVMGLLCNLCIIIRGAQAFWLLLLGVPKSLSLMRYHDEVLSRVLSLGLVEADEFDWRDYLLRRVGEDLVVRNIAPLEVKNQNKDFIKYLFHYPKGVEMMMGMLASGNNLLQQTAANMPGFWASEANNMEKDGMELLSRLGEKLGMPGKVAEGAANSFKALAVAWRGKEESPLLKVYVSRSGGSGGYSSCAPVHRSMSTLPESRETISSSSQGEGHQAGADQSGGSGESDSAALDGAVESRGAAGSSGSCRGGDELKWNVVQKVVDLVVNKRVPTLQVYIRALDSFFMSESVKNSLAKKERKQITGKLLNIIRGAPRPRPESATAEQTNFQVDPRHKERTRLLALSALDRLGSETPQTCVALLQMVDGVLKEVPHKSVIWIEEVERYEELCRTYSHEAGEWLKSGNWVVNQI